ncbi:hypothetical protein BJX62DRAFT_248498 [Aspergillus germanicus]
MRPQSVNPSPRSSSSSHSLVAVFFGGTTGIDYYTLRALAKVQVDCKGKGFRAYLVGRKVNKATEVIAEYNQIYLEGKITFVQVDDLTLITDVNRACAKILRLEKEEEYPRIDYLMLSQGGPIMMPRRGTVEGLDKLQPLLVQSPKPATAVSVYAAGLEAKLFEEDLSLRSLDKYSYSQARSHMIYMKMFFFEALATQNKGKLALLHIFPRPCARTRIFIPLLGRLLTIDPWESGERILALASKRYPPQSEFSTTEDAGDMVRATNGHLGGGSYALTWNGEDNSKPRKYKQLDKEGLREPVAAHTIRAFGMITEGGVFSG